jgi:outer membrane protein assembly factor BamB
MISTEGLADEWPEQGPMKLWHRELGDGYATIVVDGGLLYTMYRVDEDEFTVALDAKTGETVWEHKNPSPFTPLMAEYGPGPHATPTIAGNRLYTIGTNAVMHCYNKKTGTVLWKHDLAAEYGAPIPGRGYGCSPIAYKNAIIVGVDRDHSEDEEEETDSQVEANGEADHKPEGQSLVAFDQATGDIVWKSQDFHINYASPILINFKGEEQLVFLMMREIMGVNPSNGKLLWNIGLTPEGAHLSTPVFNGDDLLFCSSAYGSGSRVIKLTKQDGKTVPEELWYTRKMRIHHANAIQIDDHIYGSSGDFGPAFFAALNLKTGKAAWRERGFAKATCVYGDGKLIILDENGELALATVTPEAMTVHSRCKIAERYAWATPTLVGTTLYVRDRQHIMALDLS